MDFGDLGCIFVDFNGSLLIFTRFVKILLELDCFSIDFEGFGWILVARNRYM